jgi:hypothetical protein
MNQTILIRLEKEAEKMVLQIPVSLDSNLFTWLFNEKFAELIVRECAGIVQTYMSRWPEDAELTKQIKQHFGVEE